MYRSTRIHQLAILLFFAISTLALPQNLRSDSRSAASVSRSDLVIVGSSESRIQKRGKYSIHDVARGEKTSIYAPGLARKIPNAERKDMYMYTRSETGFVEHNLEGFLVIDTQAQLGRGGFGEVCVGEMYNAQDPPEKIYQGAIKLGKSSEGVKEAEGAIMEKGIDSLFVGHVEFIMEYNRGKGGVSTFVLLEKGKETLYNALFRVTRTGEWFAFGWAVAIELLLGIRDMHDKGIVHRDIKPGNVLDFEATPKNSERYGHIDFGSAVDARKFMSGSGWRLDGIGTQGYKAPEIWRGPAAKRKADKDHFNLYDQDVTAFAWTHYDVINPYLQLHFHKERIDLWEDISSAVQQTKPITVAEIKAKLRSYWKAPQLDDCGQVLITDYDEELPKSLDVQLDLIAHALYRPPNPPPKTKDTYERKKYKYFYSPYEYYLRLCAHLDPNLKEVFGAGLRLCHPEVIDDEKWHDEEILNRAFPAYRASHPANS